MSLAWARVHGVGVPRDLRVAARLLRGAVRDSRDDVEAVVPALAYAGVGALRVAERLARMMGFERALERRWRWPGLVDDGTPTSRPFPTPDPGDDDPRRASRVAEDRSRRGAAGKGMSDAFRAPLEDALLTLLVCGAAAVGVARAALGGGAGAGAGAGRGAGGTPNPRGFVADVAARPVAGAAVVAVAVAVAVAAVVVA